MDLKVKGENAACKILMKNSRNKIELSIKRTWNHWILTKLNTEGFGDKHMQTYAGN